MQHDVSARPGPQAAVPSASTAGRRAIERGYWRGVVRWTLLGLAGWLLVTCAVSWFAASFNRWTVAGAPAGFWLAAQGAIVAYLVIIVVHGWAMDRLESRRRTEVVQAGVSRPGST